MMTGDSNSIGCPNVGAHGGQPSKGLQVGRQALIFISMSLVCDIKVHDSSSQPFTVLI